MGVKLTTNLHLVLRLKMRETSYFCSLVWLQGVHCDNFTFKRTARKPGTADKVLLVYSHTWKQHTANWNWNEHTETKKKHKFLISKYDTAFIME